MPEPQQQNSQDIALKAAQSLAEAEVKLRAALADVDSSAVFSSYSLYRMTGMNKNLPSNHTRPAPSAIELAAWLLYPEFKRNKSRDGQLIQAAITALEEYESAFTFAEMFPQLMADDPDDALAAHLRIYSGMVRGSAYPIQIVKRIEGVMRGLELELSTLVGIGPCRACKIITALATQVEENVNGLRDGFQEVLRRGRMLAAKEKPLIDTDQKRLIQYGDEMRRLLSMMEGEWSPTQTQVAARLGGMSESEWVALAKTIGFTPASRAMSTKVVDVQYRPVFFLDEERAFCIHGSVCFDAVFAFFDNLARNDASLRDRYGQLISNWMETEIERHLQRLFPAASVIRNACFPDPDNERGETEADVVVVWGPFLIVFEAKGKRVAPESWRGNLAKLKQTIGKNIQDAFIQSQRVVRILERDGRIRFKEKATGRVIDVEKDRLRRVMPISVTLQNLLGIPTQLAATQRLGFFKGNAYPWSVCIDDLEVITRFAGSPDVFLHYIERRTAHQGITVGLHGDELDIFGHYLDTRLHPSLYEDRKEFIGHATDPNFVFFDGGDEGFEPFYTAEWNGTPPPSNPVELKVPPQIQSLLNELRNRHDDGARWISFALLGLSGPTLVRLSSALDGMKSSPTNGKRMVRINVREGDVVINVLAHGGLSGVEFFRNVTLRSRLEHYRARPRVTISIGIDQRDSSKPFEVAQWLEGQWEYDPLLEKLLFEDQEQPQVVQLREGARKPGRNDGCPCGSGKKFKKCCISRMVFKPS